MPTEVWIVFIVMVIFISFYAADAVFWLGSMGAMLLFLYILLHSSPIFVFFLRIANSLRRALGRTTSS